MDINLQKLTLKTESLSPDNNIQGVIWAFLGVGFFSLIYVSGKLSGGNISAGQIIWFRYVGAVISVFVWLILKPSEKKNIVSEQVPVHAIRALAGGLGGMAAIYAASNMHVVSATAIGLLDGLFTIIFGVFLLKEAFGRFQWLAATVCLAGALFIVASGGLSFEGNGWFVPLVAICGALLVAIESILIKTLARSEPAISVLLYVSLFGALIFLFPAIKQWETINWYQAFAFLLLGPIAIAGQLCNIMAFRTSDAAVIGPIRYTWIIWGAAFGWFLFGEVITLEIIGGSVLILLGGIYLATSRSGK